NVGKLEKQPEESAEELVITEQKQFINENPDFKKSKNGISSLRCLYIEDQVDSQILFKVQMKDLKNIQFAASFEEALPLLDSNEFDFIIMDINLQGEYNGLDALKVIHQIPKFQKIPVIAVTAYVLPGDKEKFIATGFTDFISKPIFRDKLVESLNKIFVN
ncbi:MAG: response regulator, partial [Ignavibacteriaceae bacterium]|nr:response regulator [Ignavibacteriaceae bacterium]